MSKHIVFATTGSLGDLYPFLALGNALTEQGHRVTIATTLVHEETVRQAGLNFSHMGPDPEPTAAFHAKFMHPTKSAAFVFKDYLAPAIRQSYNDLVTLCRSADLLISQSLALAAPLVAARTGLPWVSAVFQPMTLFSAYDPPALPYIPFRAAPRNQQAIAWNQRILQYAKNYTRDWVIPITALKQDLNIPTHGHPIYDGQYAPTLNLALFSPLLGQPQPDWPTNTLQTGSVAYTQPGDADFDTQRLDDFLAAGPQPIIFTLGASSSNDAADFYIDSIKAVQALGLRAILLTGGLAANDSRLQPLPETILRLDYAPYATIFQHAAIIVHAGGIGTAMRALQAGRPQILVPSAHDQLDNARRVEQLGVAKIIKKNHYHVTSVTRALRAVLSDDGMMQRATALIQPASEDGLSQAIAAIEQVLAHG